MLDALLLTLAAGLILLTMAVHSLLGQKRLIQPTLSIEDDILTHPLARFLIGFAWHLTSAIGAVLAAILLAWAWVPDHARAIGLAATSVVFLASGVYDAIGSRGRHIGWPLLVAIGAVALAALFQA